MMSVTDKADLLLEKYGDRSKWPDDEKQLKAILRLANRCKQELRAEVARLEKLASCNDTKQEFKAKTKK